MFDEFDPGLPMMLTFLFGLFVTIVLIDLQPTSHWAIGTISVIGFFVVLFVISFRYHCVAKDAILSEQESEQ